MSVDMALQIWEEENRLLSAWCWKIDYLCGMGKMRPFLFLIKQMD
jgi:hypothetical protein